MANATDGLKTVSLRAGTLDNTSWLIPVARFFTRRA
jgi:hypothetical protein